MKFFSKFVLYLGVAIAFWWVLENWNSPRKTNLITSPQVADIQRVDEARLAESRKIWKRIEDRLALLAPEMKDGLGSPVSDKQIRDLESRLGYKLPGELIASLKVHHGSDEFVDSYCLYTTEAIFDNWEMYVEIASTYLQFPIDPDPEKCDPFWHPGWIPVAGWDAYELIINLENGNVYSYNDPGISWEADSWNEWLRTVAERLERKTAPEGYDDVFEWISSDYPTPGSKKTWAER